MLMLQIRYPADKLEVGMTVVSKHIVGTHEISTIRQLGYGPLGFHCKGGYTLSYEQYDYSVVDLDDAIRLEDDPIKKLALQILAGDPMACDAARDVLRL